MIETQDTTLSSPKLRYPFAPVMIIDTLGIRQAGFRFRIGRYTSTPKSQNAVSCDCNGADNLFISTESHSRNRLGVGLLWLLRFLGKDLLYDLLLLNQKCSNNSVLPKK